MLKSIVFAIAIAAGAAAAANAAPPGGNSYTCDSSTKNCTCKAGQDCADMAWDGVCRTRPSCGPNGCTCTWGKPLAVHGGKIIYGSVSNTARNHTQHH